MSSLFRPRHRSPDDDRGSGGKLLRGRRPATSSASPYQRPPALPPPPPSPRSPSWLTGILSGAGKIISSVFASSQSASSTDDYSSDEEDIISTSSEDDDIDTTAEELHEINQGGKKQELIRDYVEASSAIIPRSETKLAIEQLLMQETFSRDEYKKLMEILQSRVVDCSSAGIGEDGIQKEIPNNTSGSAISFLGGRRSLNQYNQLQDAIPYSSNILNSPSPGLSALQTCTPDLRATAVMEAKKWLEGKKLTTSSKDNLDCGPCTLNTDTLHYGFEGELDSPVDMAKSYMRSLPPWQSSSLCSVGFKTPPSSGTHLYEDHTYATNNHSLPSSKVLKRNYLASEPWNAYDEIRRVRTKSTNLLEIPNNGQIDPSTSFLDHKASMISSAVEKRDAEDQNPICPNGTLSLPDEKATEVSHSVETGSFTSVRIISKLSEALNAEQLTNESATGTASLPSQSELGSKSKLSDLEVHILNDNQDVEEPSQTKEAISSFSLPNESLALPSTQIEHDGEPLSETKTMLPEETKLADPRDADVSNHEDIQFPTVQSSGVGERLQAAKSLQVTSVEGLHPTTDVRPRDGDAQLENDATDSDHRIATNGAPAEYNANSNVESFSKGGPSPTSSNIKQPAAAIPDSEGSSEHLSEVAATDLPDYGTNTHTRKTSNGMSLQPTEQTPTAVGPGTSRRGKKAVVRSRRGRGKVK